ncbi:MAG: hypothetical protein RJA29_2421 [Pseudomonadota bacterium]
MSQPVTTPIRFFTAAELECKGSRVNGRPGTGVIRMHPTFATELVRLREACGRPVAPNSVCRTPAHNRAVGGHVRSLHLTDNPHWPTLGCMAMDWPWRSWTKADQLAFARLAWRMGWSVGLHDGFCHIDRRADLGLRELPQAVFLYGTWTGRFGPAEVRQ